METEKHIGIVSVETRPAIVLLQPPGACSQFTRSGSKYPPLGLCQLAAVAEPCDVVVLDADGLGLDREETLQEIERLNPVAVGMTLTTYTLDMVNEFVGPLRAQGRQVVIGGPQATLDPKGTLEKCTGADWVMRGEAEMVFPEAVRRLREGRPLAGLAGVCYRDASGEAVISEESPVVPDLDLLPLPRLDGLPLRSYWCPDSRRLPMMTMMTARGCPHRCGFCSSPALYGRKLRSWSVAKVLDYIEHCVHNFGIREISFVDDVFTIDKERLRRLCTGIIERKIDITWFCNSRADQITEELAELARKAGCHQMYLGFESGDPRVLKTIRKDTTVDKLERGAEYLKRQGIARSVGFVVGQPGEDDEGVDMSIEMAKRVGAERLQFTRWTPLKGSPLYDQRAEGHDPEGGFHSSVCKPARRHEADERVRRMYAACGRGTLVEQRTAPPGPDPAAGAAAGPDGRGGAEPGHRSEVRVLHPRPGEFAGLFPEVRLGELRGCQLAVAVLTLETRHSTALLSREGQVEWEEKAQRLLAVARQFRTSFLSRAGSESSGPAAFCDAVDPRSGRPCHGPPSAGTLLAGDARQELLGLRVRELGCCPVLEHPEFGACAVSLPIFCVGGGEALRACLEELRAHGFDLASGFGSPSTSADIDYELTVLGRPVRPRVLRE